MKKSCVSLAGIFVLVAVLFSGCASAEMLVNPNVTFPLDVSEDSPALIFPISLHMGGGDPDAIGLAITGAAAAKFGTTVISGQQLYDFVGNLSWTLGEALRRSANNGEWTLSGSQAAVFDEFTGILTGLTDGLVGLGLLPAGYEFRYVVVLHADGAGGITPPGTLNFYAFGGIFDMTTNEVTSYIEKKVTVAEDAALGMVPNSLTTIVQELINGEASS